MRSMWRIGLTLGVVAIVLLVVIARLGHQEMERVMHRQLDLKTPQLLRIAAGDSAASIARQMETQGWLPDYRWFVLRARLDGVAEQIKAGAYEISRQDTPLSILQRIVRGDTKQFLVQFIEGTTIAEIRTSLAAAPELVHTIETLDNQALAKLLDIAQSNPEGWFFPAGYRYHAGSSDMDILRRAHQLMQAELEQAWSSRATDLPYASAYEALIMASIIEKETGQANERATIAGVFVRRLKKGMKLQTDPTVIYGVGAEFNGNITRADLRRDTPYNTYTRSGLPPTPIALAGRAALHAALHPSTGKALYFVARGDGSHQFSNTLNEHNRAVRRYQLKP